MTELAELRKRARELGSMVAFSEWGTHFVIMNTQGQFYGNCRNLEKSTGGYKGQANVGGWKLIKCLYANHNETYAVTLDGTLISTSEQYGGPERRPLNFKIAEIVNRDFRLYEVNKTVGLRTDGMTFVLNGLTLSNGTHSLFEKSKELNNTMQSWGRLSILKCLCNSSDVYAGVSEDGQVHFTYGWRRFRKLEEIREWKDVCDFATMVWGDNDYEIIGLRKDGTLRSTYQQDTLWLKLENVVQIETLDDYGKEHVYALLADGKVYDCYFSDMTLVCEDAVAIRSFGTVTACIKKDGTVSVYPESKAFHDGNFRIFDSLETYRDELACTEKKARDYLSELAQERAELENKLPKLQGIFKKKQREQTEQRLAEIEVLSSYDNPSYTQKYYTAQDTSAVYSIQQYQAAVLENTKAIAGKSKKNSVIASAAAGAIIAGPVGAVIGAIYAMDKNTNSK